MDKTRSQVRNENAGMMLRTIAAIQDHCARLASQMVDRDGDFRLPDRGSVDKIEYFASQLDQDWRDMAATDPFRDKAKRA